MLTTSGIERVLEASLRPGGVRTVFQPIVDLKRRTVIGYEALSRFSEAGTEGVSVEECFRHAHEFGLGSQLDVVSLRAALAHRADLPRNCFLTVNVDPMSLADDTVSRLLAAQGRLDGLIVELTEHRDYQLSELQSVVARLRSQGARFALDDAGSGYSGLQQILKLRPSILKIDRTLIAGIDTDEAKVALLEGMGRFADRIDAWILAEGVETLAEAQRLVELAVPMAQGYYLGYPGAPWGDVDHVVAGELREFARHDGETLHRLVDPVVAVRSIREAAEGFVSSGSRWRAVVDEFDRPLGLVDQEAALYGELIPAQFVNVYSSPSAAARRVSTASVEPGGPLVVTDNAGRYLGLISLRRLLVRLTENQPNNDL